MRRLPKGQVAAYAMMDALEIRQLLSATHLGFSVQPTDTVAGHSVSTITVDVLDGTESVVTSSSALVTFSIASGPLGESLFFAVPAVNGVVTLDGISFTTAGNYTLRASATGLTAAVSSSFAITPDAADHLVLTDQPSSTTAGQTISTLHVSVEDQFGNVVTSNSSNVTLALASGSGTLLGTTTVAAVSGVATFNDLSIHNVGTFTLGVSDGGLTADTSGSFSISPAAASKLVITQQPGNITAGQTISTILVSVEDQYNNVVTTNSSSVTIALASGSGTLGGTKTVSAVNGVATFSTLSLPEAGTYTLGVSDGGLTADTSSSFTVSAASATHLVFTQQPGNATAGTLGTIQVSIEDQYGNVVTSNTSNVTLSVATGSGTMGGTKTVAAISGVASFTGLTITKTDGYTLSAVDGSLTGATSSSFTVSPDSAAKLVITQQTSSTAAGHTLSTILVAVRDQYDNLVTSDSSSVTIALASGSGTLLGTKTVSASGGIATFSTLSIHEAGTFTLGLSDGGLTAATSSSFVISPDTASQLVVTQQPGNISAGALGTVTVSVEDQYGNVVTGNSSTVTLAPASGPGSLLGTTSVAAVNGVATFSGLSIHTAGTYTLGASDGSLTQATSSSFVVSPLSATHLEFTAQPSSIVAGNLLTGVTAAIKDQYSNTVTSSSANVTFKLTGGGSTFTFVVAASSGVATLNSVYLVKAGSYSVRATSSGITLADSNTITVTPDVASQLVITQDTSSAVAGHTLSSMTVQVQDQFGNLVTNDTSSVHIAIASGSGTLLGTTTVTASGGVATFSTLSIQHADNFTLTVSDGGLTTATSASLTISPDAASKLAFTVQPASDTAGHTLSSISVSVEDQYGNVVTGNSSNVVIAIGSGTGTLLGTKTVAASSGVATFTTLAIQKSGAFTFSATDGSLTAATSNSFNITADAADHLAIVQQPVSGSAGSLSTIIVQVQDQYNNIVTTDSSNVSIAINTGSGTLLGTTTVAAVNGVATFSTLAFHTPGARTLQVTDGGLTAATTDSFTISTAAPSQLVITQDTSSDTAGNTLSTILVSVEDQYGNMVTNNTSSVHIAISSGTGTLLGTTTVSAVSGVATFSTLSIRKAGDFTLQVTDGSLTAATTGSFTLSPGAATHLAITQQTASAVAGHTLSTLIVAVEDQYNNVVTTDSSSVVVAIGTGTGSLLGTKTVSASSGVATFSTLSIQDAGNFTLNVTDGALTDVSTSSFTISPDAADHIAITQQPTDGLATNAVSPINVALEDQYGNIITSDTSTSMTVTIATGGGVLTGTSVLTVNHGIASFSGVHTPVAGTYTLQVAANGVTSAISDSFAITAGPASVLHISQQPTTTVAGQTVSNVVVQVWDAVGNVVTSDTSNVTIAMGSGNVTLTGTKTVAAVAGVATFSTLSINTTGSYTLAVTDGSLTSATTSSFAVTPDAATHLVFTQAPANHAAGSLGTIAVSVEDQFGNVVTTDTSTVLLAIASGSGTLLGTFSVAAVNGVATFSAASIHVADSYTLTASDGGLTDATSASFTISPTTASQIVLTQQPTDTVAGHTISTILASIEDQYGNVVTTNTSNVTIAMSSGNVALGGTKTVAAVAGVATFSTLSINTSGSYTLSLTDGSLTSATTSSIAITADAATHLVITQGPTTTVAGQTMSTINVSVEDQYGNVVTSDVSNVTMALNGTVGTLSGTKTVAAVSGVASFTTLSMTRAGSYTVAVSDGALTGATSSSYTITPDVATHLTLTQDAVNVVAGNTLTSIIVAVHDQYENVVTTDSSSVMVAIASGTGTLLGTKTVSAVNGVATFSTLSIQKAGAFTLSLTDGSLTAATTASFTVTPATASQLVFTTQPGSAVAGNLLSTIAVSVEDQYGNVVTTNSSNISLSINNGGVNITLVSAASSGVASFSGIALTKSGTFAFRATGASLPAANSNNFTISPDVASTLSITQQPANGSAGTLGTVIVAVHDQYGNVVTTDSSNVTLAIASGSATLSGTTTVAAVSGIATFSAVTLTKPGTYTVDATDGSLSADTSSSFTITPAAASQLVITQQTSSTIAGQTLSTLQVSVEDQYGNVVTNNTSNVTVAIATGTGSLLGSTTVAAVSGVASFSNLSIQKSGVFTLGFSDASLTGANSSSFTLSPGTASKLAFTQQPANGTAGTTLSTILVSVEDQYGNVVTSDSSSVTLTLSNGGVTLNGTTTATASSGVATFSGLSINKTGSFTVAATDASLTSATSSSFSIASGAASKLVMTQQPASGTVGGLGTITVAVEDQYNNIVTTDSSSVTVAIASGTGSLLGTKTVSASSGVATFSTLGIHTPGSFTLGFSDGGLASATSSSFTLSVGAADHLQITQQPASGTVGGLGTITVAVEDQYNNIVTTDSSSVTVAIASGTGSLLGTKTVSASSGVATFSTLGIHTPGSFTLGFSDGGLASATSSSFTLSAGAADHLQITQQPVNGTVGGLGTITVAVEDQYNNVVTTDSSSVTVAIASGTGSLLGTKTVSASSGVATFSTLGIHTPGSFALGFFDGALTLATSNTFVLAVGVADHLHLTQQPSSGQVGGLGNLVVAIEDQYGNVLTSDTSSMTVAIASGTGTLLGTKTVAANNGVATFSTLGIHTPGNFTLGLSDGSLTATSSSFTLSVGAADHLQITQQLSSGQVGGLRNLVVAVEDQYGNIITSDSSNVTVAIVSGTASLLGTTTVAATNGVATFSTLGIHTPGTFVLGVTDGGVTAASSNSFTLTTGAANHLQITEQPVSGTVGGLSTITVAVQDQYNNVVTTDHSVVNLAIASGSGTLTGATAADVSNGVATFSSASITKSGTYTLSVSDGSLTSATSESFTLTPGSATKVAFTTAPTDGTAGQLGTVAVSIEDQYGNIVTDDTSDVTVTISAGTGTLGGTATVSAINGVATFSDLAIVKADDYVLSATDGELTQGSTETFTVSAGNASQLVITTGPSDTIATSLLGTITVAVEDQYGNIVTSDTSDISIDVATGTGTMSGTSTVTAVEGVATFSDLAIRQTGTYSLSISDDGLDTVTTDTFDITPGAPARVVFDNEPTTQALRTLGNITVNVLDQYGNLVDNSTASVTISIASGPGTISGTTTVAAVEGVATFSDLALSKNGTYTLRASGSALTVDTTDSFVVGAKLVFQKQPATTVAGVTIGPVLKVMVVDSANHVITTESSAITLSVFSGPGELDGTLVANAVNGVATFSDLSITTSGNYRIEADTDTMTLLSNTFTVKPAATTQMVILQDVSNTVAGVKIGPAVTVKFMDAFGNLAINDHSAVTMTIGTGPNGGALSGTVKANITNGIATFSNLVLKKSGNYTLHAATGGLSVDTGSLAVTPGIAKKIVFTQQPTTVGNGVDMSPGVVVDIVDAFGNLAAVSSNVTLTLASGPNGSVLNTTLAATNGHAVFSHLSFAALGKYKIKASVSGLALITSNQFTVVSGGIVHH